MCWFEQIAALFPSVLQKIAGHDHIEDIVGLGVQAHQLGSRFVHGCVNSNCTYGVEVGAAEAGALRIHPHMALPGELDQRVHTTTVLNIV